AEAPGGVRVDELQHEIRPPQEVDDRRNLMDELQKTSALLLGGAAGKLLACERLFALFRFASFREIACHLREADDVSLRVLQRRDDDARPETRAVLAHAPALVLEAPVTMESLEDAIGLP